MTIAPPVSPIPRQQHHTAPRLGPTGAPTTPMLTVDLGTVPTPTDSCMPRCPVSTCTTRSRPTRPAVLDVLLTRAPAGTSPVPAEIDAVLAVDPDPSGPLLRQHREEGRRHRLRPRPRRTPVRRRLRRRAGQADRPAPGATLLVRITTSGAGADWALGQKFGCDEATAGRLLARAVTHGHPVGICFHVGSQQHDVTAWDEPLATTARLRALVRARGSDLAVVDLGGGFPAHAADPTPDVPFGTAIMAAVGRSPRSGRAAADGRAGSCARRRCRHPRDRGGPRLRARRPRWVYVDVGLFSGLAETMGEAIRYRITAHRDRRPLDGGPRRRRPGRTDVRQRRRALPAAPSSAACRPAVGDRLRSTRPVPTPRRTPRSGSTGSRPSARSHGEPPRASGRRWRAGRFAGSASPTGWPRSGSSS